MRLKLFRRLIPSCLFILVLLPALVGIRAAAATGSDSTGPADAEIVSAVEREFSFDQVVPSHRLDVVGKAGIVTISGSVDTLLASERAVTLAETVKGVRSVVNRIRVAPPRKKSDAAVQADIENALIADPATEIYQVDVNVDRGIGTLTGLVDSYREKRLAAIVAKGISGVRSLENQISVSPPPRRPESDIRNDIEQGLKWDVLVDHRDIRVTLDDSTVVLEGTVGSAAEKTRALRHAWVAGVTQVEMNGLEVAQPTTAQDLRDRPNLFPSDEKIKGALTAALILNPRVLSSQINLTVDGGVAVLKGTVNTLAEKMSAGQTARNTTGVVRVKNRLRVSPLGYLNDPELAENLREALGRDAVVEPFDLSVRVVAGTAELSGVVDTYFEKSRAESLAARLPGILDVENHLVVQNRWKPFFYDPYVDDRNIYESPWYRMPKARKTGRSDRDIKADIETELWWSPYVDSDRITVRVEQGKAVLTGEVSSWLEYFAADENALEGGAVSVDNDLEISNDQD